MCGILVTSFFFRDFILKQAKPSPFLVLFNLKRIERYARLVNDSFIDNHTVSKWGNGKIRKHLQKNGKKSCMGLTRIKPARKINWKITNLARWIAFSAVVTKNSQNLEDALREIVLKKHRKHPIIKRVCLQEDREWHLTYGMLQDVLERPFDCVYRPSQWSPQTNDESHQTSNSVKWVNFIISYSWLLPISEERYSLLHTRWSQEESTTKQTGWLVTLLCHLFLPAIKRIQHISIYATLQSHQSEGNAKSVPNLDTYGSYENEILQKMENLAYSGILPKRTKSFC